MSSVALFSRSRDKWFLGQLEAGVTHAYSFADTYPEAVELLGKQGHPNPYGSSNPTDTVIIGRVGEYFETLVKCRYCLERLEKAFPVPPPCMHRGDWNYEPIEEEEKENGNFRVRTYCLDCDAFLEVKFSRVALDTAATIVSE